MTRSNVIPVDFVERRALAVVAREVASSKFARRDQSRCQLLNIAHEHRILALRIESAARLGDEHACRELERVAQDATKLIGKIDCVRDELFELTRRPGA